MNSNRPYLIRAIYEWLVDSDLTPYMVIDAAHDGVQVPGEYVEEGKIILNIAPEACRGLHLENDRIIFTAKFSGEAVQIFVPPLAVMALYSKENGKGMFFNNDGESDPSPTPNPTKTKVTPEANSFTKPSREGMNKARLTLVKGIT